jgi:M6 family metalloprotease-like protein
MIMIKKLPLTFLTVLLLSIFSIPSYGAWINFEPQTIVQPNGDKIQCFATGDEFYNWLHDENGYTIIQNHNDGYYYYAILDGDQLIPSSFLVGSANPNSLGINAWTNISPKKMKAFRDDFLKNKMPEKPQIPGYENPKNIKNEGELNNLVVYIRFSDQSEFSKDTIQYYIFFNKSEAGYNSMNNYFKTVSYDMLSIPSWFYPQPPSETVISYQDIYERGYFMPYDPVSNPIGYQSGQSGEREHALLKRACAFIEDEVPEDLIIDKNNDGYIDNMVFIVRGATTAWATLLWPHRWSLYGETVYINGKRAWDYNLQVEDHLNNSGPGVLCHEMFHSLSAPDLYHYSSAPYTSVGPWDLMDNNANPPQSMGAYMKYRYGGWIDNIPEITECGTYTINPISDVDNNCFKIASPNSNTDYYVLEYRVKEGTFEGGLPGTGLLVYRINLQQNGNGNAQGPPDEVYLYRPGGSNSSNGSLGNAYFSADVGRTEINDGTDPDPFLTNGQAGGLDISNISFVGETISFDVNFEKEPVAEFETSENILTEGCSINFTDFSLCNVTAWEWTFEGGTPSSSNLQNPEGIVYPTEGNYSVSLKVSNNFGENTITKNDFIEVSASVLPEVVFFASDSAVCTGNAVILNDFSDVCPESWNWNISPSTHEFINGSNASSQNPEVQFNEPGSYLVSLTVTNANGSSTLDKDDYIFAGGTPIPFFEDFESGNAEQSGWTIVNPDNDDITWETFSVDGNGGSKAAGINLFNYNVVFKRDQLISPPIDLTGINNATLKFDHAYAIKSNPDYSDSLIVKISNDCGNSWTRILALADDGSGNFATHEASQFNFIPAIDEDWCGSGYGSACIEASISEWANQSNVMIMFESVRLVGNNLFIDNVSVNITTDVDDEKLMSSSNINIYPNPTNGNITIELHRSLQEGSVLLYNSSGDLVFETPFSNVQNILSYDFSQFSDGIYILRIIGDNHSIAEKLMIR